MSSHRSSLGASLTLAATALVLAAGSARAQAIPSPAQAQQMIQADPAMLQQLRERILSSGLTPEQVRARLRAAGYSEELLDQIMRGSAGPLDARATTEVLQAVRDLGITDEADLRELRRLSGIPELAAARDERRIVDSLSLRDSTVSVESATIFGLSLFRESTSLFMPNLAGPVDAGYRLGAGDRLALILTGEVEQSHVLDVARDGSVVIPGVGRLGVANLTLGELEDLLYSRLGRVHSSISRGANARTTFSVTVTELRSNQVFVAGDVARPGSYRVTSAGTALTALYAAGGPTDRGSLRQVEVRRGGARVAVLDVYDYLVRGDASRDVRLEQGDLVFVPVHGPRLRVDGAIARPATYELKAGESLADAVTAAGGLRADADGRRIVVERILPVADRSTGRARAVIEVPLEAGRVPAFAAADGDLVRVPTIADRVRDRIVVRGHVWTPGPQGFTPGLTLEQALRRAGGLPADAYLGTVHISRLRGDSTRVLLRAMVADTSGRTVEPFALQEDDEITVFSRTEFRPPASVAIAGAVRKGGRFPWREGMTLRDLALLAGGLDISADLREAEIARIPAARDLRATATTLRVPLDSSYRFDLAARPAQAGEVVLSPYDQVLILRDPTWRQPRSVWITGEVRSPGRYTLTDRSERLAAVLRRAGGLTPEANPSAAHFSRYADSTAAQRIAAARLRRLMRDTTGRLDSIPIATALATASVGGALRSDAAALWAEQDRRDSSRAGSDSTRRDASDSMRPERMRVGLDLRRALDGGADDLVLQDGDSLHVPVRSEVVQVRGAVHQPSATVVAPGRSLQHYVRAAGGPNALARTRQAYVIQPSGKVETRRYFLWVIRLDPTPEPGAVVVVPERPAAVPPPSAAQGFAIVAQLLTAIATVVLLTQANNP